MAKYASELRGRVKEPHTVSVIANHANNKGFLVSNPEHDHSIIHSSIADVHVRVGTPWSALRFSLKLIGVITILIVIALSQHPEILQSIGIIVPQ